MEYRKKIDEIMNTIEYGWVDKNGGRHYDLAGFSDNYALQMPNELLESRLGVCWDQVELERHLLESCGVKAHPFFIVYYNGDKRPTHTFILIEDKDKTIWYEHAWKRHAGWHEFDNTNDAIRHIRDIFIKEEKLGDYNPMNLVIYMDYPAPNRKLGCLEFYKHCEDKKNPRFKVKQ